MNDFVIVTDSSADLPEDLVRELGVEVLPLSFTVKGQTYHNYPDDREMDPKVFYKMLRDGEMATTAAVNVGEFTALLEPMLQAGKDVLILAFSSAFQPPTSPPPLPWRSLPPSTRSARSIRWTPSAPPWARGCWSGTPCRRRTRAVASRAVRDWAEAPQA